MKKSIILIIIVAAITLIALFIFQKTSGNNEQSISEKQEFMSNRNKAGELKFEEQSKKAQAEQLLKEAEEARIEKEKALGIYQTGDNGKLITEGQAQ